MKDKAKNLRHKQRMQALKKQVDSSLASANKDQGLCLLLTGDGKGKTSSAFGMLMRSLAYGKAVGIVQFIKGEQPSGEENYIRQMHPEIPFYQMGTGFTWNTQDREADIHAALQTWTEAKKLLKDESIELLLLDELTYMLSFKYLEEQEVVNAIRSRPNGQHVVITGRGGGKALKELADTVSEIRNIKHAYESGIKAQQGVDY
jgi:cob(I)alamin adenosyltransferase